MVRRLGLGRIFVAFIELGDPTGKLSQLTVFIIAVIVITGAGLHFTDP